MGPRSAVFAPIDELGLIVVDEEHDSSYKHEGDPRYDARDVAAERAERAGALLLAGSATPRPESIARMPVALLAHRVDGRPLPAVQVLDMREQPHGLHPATSQALAEVRAARGKAIVLLNRRGWSNFLSCRSCGRVWSCPHCDVALVLHRGEGLPRLPSLRPPRARAGSLRRVLLDLGRAPRRGHRAPAARPRGRPRRRRLPRLPPRRRHRRRTEARRRAGPRPAARRERSRRLEDGGVAALLRRFEAAECGVLIGTQMVAKGHDFPDVSLGVVLDADATLRFPDFRAEERTFALIAQLAGRVGRGGEGRVLVQTIAPEARAIVHAARHDSDGFLAGELQRRRALDYPPYSHILIGSSARPRSAPRARGPPRAPCASGWPRRRGGLERARPRRAVSPARARALGRDGQGRRAPRGGGGGRARPSQRVSAGGHAGVSFSVDVDPQ